MAHLWMLYKTRMRFGERVSFSAHEVMCQGSRADEFRPSRVQILPETDACKLGLALVQEKACVRYQVGKSAPI
jgi:hypothetical protein